MCANFEAPNHLLGALALRVKSNKSARCNTLTRVPKSFLPLGEGGWDGYTQPVQRVPKVWRCRARNREQQQTQHIPTTRMNKKDFEDRLSKDMKYKLDTFSMVMDCLDPVEDIAMIADFLVAAREVCQDQQIWEFWITDTLARLVTLEEAQYLLLNKDALNNHHSHHHVPQLKYSKLRLGSNYRYKGSTK